MQRSRTKKPVPTKSKRLEVRVTETEMAQLKELADRHGLTISAYAVRRLLTSDTVNDNDLETRHRPSPKKAELYRSVSRSNLLLDEIRQHLADAQTDISRPLMCAVLHAMIAIDDKLDSALVS